jgi:hypothetical protein
VIDQTAPARDELMEQLYASLRKPRPEAAKEVNWLLVSVAQEARNSREQAEMYEFSWELSVERQLAELEDEPSTVYDYEDRRSGLEESARKAAIQQEQIQQRFDERRAIFAEMLKTVRESARVPLTEDTLEEIELLNEGGFLAFQLEMDQKRFTEFYGKNPDYRAPESQPVVKRELTELERARIEGIDYSRVPERAPERPIEVEVDFARQAETVREQAQPAPGEPVFGQSERQAQAAQPVVPASQTALRHAPIDIPEATQDDPGFDF